MYDMGYLLFYITNIFSLPSILTDPYELVLFCVIFAIMFPVSRSLPTCIKLCHADLKRISSDNRYSDLLKRLPSYPVDDYVLFY